MNSTEAKLVDGLAHTDNSTGQIAHTANHEWRHDVGEVIGSLLNAGLQIEAVAELPRMDWPAFPELIPCAKGWTLPQQSPRIPLNFAIVARRHLPRTRYPLKSPASMHSGGR